MAYFKSNMTEVDPLISIDFSNLLSTDINQCAMCFCVAHACVGHIFHVYVFRLRSVFTPINKKETTRKMFTCMDTFTQMRQKTCDHLPAGPTLFSLPRLPQALTLLSSQTWFNVSLCFMTLPLDVSFSIHK